MSNQTYKRGLLMIAAFLFYHGLVIACYQAFLKLKYHLPTDHVRFMDAVTFCTIIMGVSLAASLLDFLLDPEK